MPEGPSINADSTTLKATERALRESEQRFRLALRKFSDHLVKPPSLEKLEQILARVKASERET